MQTTRRTILAAGATSIATLSTGAALSSCTSSSAATYEREDAKLVLGLSRQVTSLDPADGGSVDSDSSIQNAIYSGLAWYDADYKLTPQLAEKWEQTAKEEWTFTLRTGVTFSDGSAFDASTAVWNFERILPEDAEFSKGSTYRPIIDSVEAKDEATLIIRTKGEIRDLPDRLVNFLFASPDFTDGHNLTQEALGTGPYVLDSFDPNNGATLTRNEKYWGDTPHWDTVEYRVLASESSRVQAAQAGEIDVALQYEPSDLEQFESKEYTTGSQWSTWLNSIRFNENVAPLDDVRVRQALNHGIDKQAIIDAIFPDAGIEPAKGQLLSPRFEHNENLEDYAFDTDKASSLLKDAGYGEGLTLTLGVTSGTYVGQDNIVQIIANQLKDVGVTLEIESEAFPTWVEKTYDEDKAFALYYIGYSGENDSAGQRLGQYTSAGAQSHYKPADDEYDDFVAQLNVATDEDAQDLIDKATARYRDQAHAVFLYEQPLTYVVRNDLQWTPQPAHFLLPQDFTVKEESAS
jgi:peptide/nickel transport system substrate-binding protein